MLYCRQKFTIFVWLIIIFVTFKNCVVINFFNIFFDYPLCSVLNLLNLLPIRFVNLVYYYFILYVTISVTMAVDLLKL